MAEHCPDCRVAHLDNSNPELEQAQGEIKSLKGLLSSQLHFDCRLHPDVVSVIHWGCPDCLYEVKPELSQAKEEIKRLEGRIEYRNSYRGVYS